MFPIRQAHTSLLAARGVENPSGAELPTPGAPQHGTLVGISTISQGCPWEPTVPPKGHRAGDRAGAGGHCQAQAVPTEAPCSGSGVLFLAVVWPWGSRKGDWALCPGGHSGSIPWQGGGKGHCSGEKGAPCFGCVPQLSAVSPYPCWGWQEGLCGWCGLSPAVGQLSSNRHCGWWAQSRPPALRAGSRGAQGHAAVKMAFLSSSRHRSSSKDGSDKPSACSHGPVEGTCSQPLYFAFLCVQVGNREKGKAHPPGPGNLHSGQ